ncbi:hypothetical protein Gotri_010715 [Gossypium trilobum]|uniref:Uncharacterized protein n=1 Tax=Gossypium trilobum TaxID=34281 RepID=A0A7J9ERW1_9ROSI|nr:hypothetical protein [Gossypium trilobum]
MGKKRKSIATSLDEVDRTMYASFCSAANSLSHLYTQTMNQQKLSFQAGKRHGLSGTDRLRMLISHGKFELSSSLVGIDTFNKGFQINKRISLLLFQLGKNLSVDLETTRGRIKSYNNGYPQLPSDSKGWFSLLKCGDLLVILSTRNELDYGEEPSMSPRAPSQQQHSQPAMQFMNTGFMVSTGSSGQTAVQGTRPDHCDQQSKNLVFSNALSSPVRRSLQHYHIAQEGYCPNGGLPSGNGARNNEPSFLQNQTRDSNPLSSNDSSMDMHADSPSHESTY